MDVNMQIGLVWTVLALLSGAAPAALLAWHLGKRAGVREYHEARQAKADATRARKRDAKAAAVRPEADSDDAPRDHGEGWE